MFFISHLKLNKIFASDVRGTTLIKFSLAHQTSQLLANRSIIYQVTK